MNDDSNASFIPWRFHLVIAVIVLIVAGLIYRVFDLTILDQRFLRRQGDERVLRLVSSPAFRGMIVDRNGFPLAVSTSVYSIWANPKEFAPLAEDLSTISHLLGMKQSEITTLLHQAKNKKRAFVYLKRALSPEIANQINGMNIPGLYTQEEYRRFYPEGEATAHVIGFTNVDDRGQEGLELGYNQWLVGTPGKKWVIKDRFGQNISDVQSLQDQKSGRDLVLSIDRRVQYLAYRELMDGIIANKATSGSAIVLDSTTGEVLAMVNYPSYNPNNRPSYLSDVYRNRAVTDTFEPGSTIKAFSVASALDSGHFHPDSMINTHPGWIRVGHNVVKDEKNNGTLSVTQILQVSSNVGVTKMILSLPPDELWSVLHRVGFGEITGIGFPGEQNGSLEKHQPWSDFTLATLSFGYGISVTALQLAHAYSVLANHGVKIPLSLLKLDSPPTGERVMDEKVSQEMLTLLEAVVTKGGTGELANVPGYRVAGKTGTAYKAGAHGYDYHRFTASFVGIAPLTNPRVIVAVVIHEPKGKQHLGGYVSGPVFEKIMEGTLRILDVAPDAKV